MSANVMARVLFHHLISIYRVSARLQAGREIKHPQFEGRRMKKLTLLAAASTLALHTIAHAGFRYTPPVTVSTSSYGNSAYGSIQGSYYAPDQYEYIGCEARRRHWQGSRDGWMDEPGVPWMRPPPSSGRTEGVNRS
jgi:hypothetical protein